MQKAVSVFSVALLVWLLVAGGASAGEVVYDNFGPDMSFDPDVSLSIGIDPDGFGQRVAQQFTPEGTHMLTGVKLALRTFTEGASVRVVLMTDTNGLPGSVIEEMNVTGLGWWVGTVKTATSLLRPVLQGGTPYWLAVVANPLPVQVDTGWMLNSNGDLSTSSNFVYSFSGDLAGPWYRPPAGGQRGAFQIVGSTAGELTVAIDVKPGEATNSINLHSEGVVPVAILSSAEFDATEVDPASVVLAGGTVKLTGNGSKLACHVDNVDDDQFADLLCQIQTESTVIEQGPSTVILVGETFNGTLIRGEDTVQVVPN